MEYQVLVHKKAQQYFRSLQPKTQERLKKTLKELSNDPLTSRPKSDIKKLSGTKGREQAYRVRVGKYRIIYSIENKKIYVTTIFQRGKDYKEL